MLSTVLYYELAMKVPIPVGITVYLLTWGLGHLRCLVIYVCSQCTEKEFAFPHLWIQPKVDTMSYKKLQKVTPFREPWER